MSASGKAAFDIRLSGNFTMRALPHASSSETIICGFGGQLTRGKIPDVRRGSDAGLQPCGANPVGLSAEARNQIGQPPHIVEGHGRAGLMQLFVITFPAMAAAM